MLSLRPKPARASLILVHAVLPHESMPVETGAVPYYDPLRMDRDARLLLDGLVRDVRARALSAWLRFAMGSFPT